MAEAMTTPSTPHANTSAAVGTTVIADAGPEPSRRGGAHRRLRVGEDELVDAVEPGQRLSVERADPAESDQSESHRGPPISRTLLAPADPSR